MIYKEEVRDLFSVPNNYLKQLDGRIAEVIPMLENEYHLYGTVSVIQDLRKCIDKIKNTTIDDCISEIKQWYWQSDKQELAKDPCVVDAMIDLFIRTLKEQ